MAKWVRLQLADGSFEGEPIVSAQNLAVTRIPRIGLAPQASYAMGWVLQSTPNGQITWHNGGTTSYGAYVGTLLDKDVGVIVLTNLTNVGLPDAVGEWTLDRLLGNPEVDHAATKLAAARAAAADVAATYTRPAEPMAAPPLDALTGTSRSRASERLSLARDGERLVGTLSTGAKLAFEPWNGEVFVVSLVPEGRFAPIAANLGPFPAGFASFALGPDGKVTGFRLALDEAPGQTYAFAAK